MKAIATLVISCVLMCVEKVTVTEVTISGDLVESDRTFVVFYLSTISLQEDTFRHRCTRAVTIP